jgi:hypothetical protein
VSSDGAHRDEYGESGPYGILNLDATRGLRRPLPLLITGVALGFATLLHRSYRRDPVRASRLERIRPLAGDQLIPEPIASLTHAVTIRCRRQDLWPWLVQMGAGRAGWYSYDFIDNGGRPSTKELLPQFQSIAVGAVLPALPGATEGFIVVAYEPEHFLVLAWPSRGEAYMSTWAFVLDDVGSNHTRLIVRGRASPGYHFHNLPLWLLKLTAPLGHHIMQRKQLLEIARRAERSHRNT